VNAYLLLPLIQTFISLVLIAVVLRGHLQSFTHRLFSLFLLGLAIWGVMIFGMRASPDIGYAYSWERWLITMAPFTSVFFYHFAVRYTETRVNKFLLPFLYLTCLLFLPLAATGLVVSGMQIKPYGYAPIFGPAMTFHLLFNYGMFMMALLTFIRAYRISSDAEQRNRAAYIIIGMVFSFIGATFDILPIFGLPLYPGYIIGNILFCFLTVVAIVRYNLLDIHVVLRKSAAYALMSTIVSAPFAAAFLVATTLFNGGTFPTWGYILLLVALAIALPQLWQRVQRLVDRWFYRDRYNYLKALENFSRETQSLTDFASLGSTMVNLIAKALRSSSVYLLLPLPRGRDFTTAFSFGADNAHMIRLKRLGALVKWLERSNSMLSYEDIEIIPQLQSLTSEEKQRLQQVGAELIVPLKIPTGQLSGVLILGEKLSEQPYTGEDKQLIFTISSQISTNLENARLYIESQQEVEERKRAEEEIRASEERYRYLFENLNDAAFLADAETGQILETNKQGEVLLGMSRNEIRGMHQSALHPLDKMEEYKQRFATHVAKGRIADNEGEVIRKDGTIVPVLISALSLTFHGRHLILGLFHDITARKIAEEKERQLQQEVYRSSRLASIGELAAGVAHEINNPLTGVVGFSQRLLRKTSDEEVKRGLEIVHNEALRAAKIIQNLLTFARHSEPTKQYSDINGILQSALELRAYELKTGNIEVITDLVPSLSRALVDSHQIQEVFLNIILNAEQAMTEAHGRGKLTVKTEEIKNLICR
jgi:PAS domain S-box-containing protein